MHLHIFLFFADLTIHDAKVICKIIAVPGKLTNVLIDGEVPRRLFDIHIDTGLCYI